MSHKEIISALKRNHPHNNITLTSLMGFELGTTLTLTIRKPCENMQENEAAFEAWAIAIKCAYGKTLTKVFLDIIPDDDIPAGNPHYNRLLWRIHNFELMFDWFKAGNCACQVKEFMKNQFVNPIMNIPSKDRVNNKEGLKERDVEAKFVNKNLPYYNQLRQLIEADEILNQIPVGVFRGVISENTKIFTGGSSAIDMLGYQGQSILHLIELKTGDNIKLGILSEFLFYMAIIYGLFISDEIGYPKAGLEGSFDDYSKLHQAKTVNEIRGHLLFEKIHPLIDQEVMVLLNDGLRNFAAQNKTKKVLLSCDRIQYHQDSAGIISNLKNI